MHIAIAGNIGSGKTTLTTLLAKHLGFSAEYEDPTNNPYIYDFYKDMLRWSFNMQMYFLDMRLRTTIALQQPGQKVIQDRTLYEDAEIFAPNLLTMGLMTQRDYDTYRNLFDTVSNLIQPPDLVIYLRASVATLGGQIATRGREFEDTIRIDYLKHLNERYEAWFDQYDRGPKVDITVEELQFRDSAEDLGQILNIVKGELYGLFSEGEE
jgi:deoxyadenosine/deoxycytidine kinase